MKDLKLSVLIQKTQKEVFEFTTNQNNTPLWIDSVVKEEADSVPIKIGTEFRNYDTEGNCNHYVVTTYDPNSQFQLDALHQDYKDRYTYRAVSETETELEYYEWSESGQLHAPFMQEILDKLKAVMEAD